MELGKIFGPLFVTSGALVVLYGLYLLAQWRSFAARAGAAVGLVVRRVAGRQPAIRLSDCYHPVIRFETPDGDQVVFQADEPLPDARCRVGARIPVLYDGADPRRAKIAVGRWYDVVMTFYLGLLVSAAGLVMVWQTLAL